MFITLDDGCRLFFDVYGSALDIGPDSVREKPTMIFLHGGPGPVDHTLYVEFWSQFQDLVQIIFLDQRGCGRSDRRHANEWHLDRWGDDVAEFCQKLGIEKPIVAGLSWGGHVLSNFATRYPQVPGALIFCNTESRFIVQDVLNKLSEVADQAVIDIAKDHYDNPTPESVKKYMQHCVKYYAKNAYTPIEVGRCLQNLDLFFDYGQRWAKQFNYLEQMDKIICPTLLLVGEESPLHVPIRAIEMLEKNPQHMQMHMIKGAGAPVYKDKPEESKQVVAAFLNSVING